MNEFRYDLNKPMGNVHILFFFFLCLTFLNTEHIQTDPISLWKMKNKSKKEKTFPYPKWNVEI